MRIPLLAASIVAAAACLASSGARAFGAWSSVDFLTDQRWSQINNRLANQNLASLRKSVGIDGASSRRSATPAADHSMLRLGDAASTDLSPLRPYLATTQLSEEQAAKVLAMYNQAATRLGVPFNDSASGIAAFLAGTYAAYTNKPFPDELYKPLYRQFADSMSSGDSLGKMSKAQRVEYYQRLVVAGMVFQLLQLEMQENPDPEQIASMRKAAQSAFTEIAGISPDSIRFTSKGLVPR